jgi:uncharacterized C2H2 Zn-finger protein
MTDPDGEVKCFACDMWLNSPKQYGDHCIGKYHKKMMRRGPGMKKVAVATVKIIIPEGTALIP